jgi:hypothetical protein
LKLFGFFCRFGVKNFSGVGFHLAHSFWFHHRFEAFGANLHSFAINTFGLQIDRKFPTSGNIGMTAGISSGGSAFANITDSAHIVSTLIYYKI